MVYSQVDREHREPPGTCAWPRGWGGGSTCGVCASSGELESDVFQQTTCASLHQHIQHPCRAVRTCLAPTVDPPGTVIIIMYYSSIFSPGTRKTRGGFGREGSRMRGPCGCHSNRSPFLTTGRHRVPSLLVAFSRMTLWCGGRGAEGSEPETSVVSWLCGYECSHPKLEGQQASSVQTSHRVFKR